MTKLLPVFCLLVAPFFSFANADSSHVNLRQPREEMGMRKFHQELAINATPLIATFLKFNSSALTNPVSSVYYRAFYKRNSAKLGFGTNINKTTLSNLGFPDSKTNNNISELTLGLEHFDMLGPRWRLHYGPIVRYSINRTETVSTSLAFDNSGNQFNQTTTITNLNKSFLIGPEFGLHFSISRRIELYTEASLLFFSSQMRETTKFSTNTPSFLNQDTHSKASGISTTVPFALFVNCKL